MNKLYDLIISRRTIRSFLDKPVETKLLEALADAGRLAPAAANRQPLEFIVINDNKTMDEIFPHIALANYLEWKPAKDNQPRAYIAVLANKRLQKEVWIPYDVALAAGNIGLAAWGEGIGSCIIGAFHKDKIRELLNVPDDYEIPILIALGYPSHKAFAEAMKDNDIKYRRDDEGNFHVPKRELKDIIHYNFF